jgi:DNA-binding transcriptional LysR family regulator
MRALDLNDLRVFVRVVDRGTFAGAARDLRVPTSTVSRTIARLEHQVGARLLQRTPRSVRATAEGHALYASVGEPLGALERAAHAIEPASRTPKGVLRLSAPVELAGTFLADVVVAFADRYPQVRVDVVVTNRAVNLVDDGLDLAVRAATKLADSTLVARRLGDLAHGLYAAPRYLEVHGAPASVAELAAHRCLVFRADDLAKTWRLADAARGTVDELALHAGLGADDFSSVRALAVAGGGVALMPRLVCAKDEAAGRLVRVLPQVSARGASLYLVYPSAAHLPARVAAFRTAVTAAFEAWCTRDASGTGIGNRGTQNRE